MRLLHATHRYMKVFHGSNIPPYIILSHRWEDEDEEVELKDFELDTACKKKGYVKVENLCRIARECRLEWVWLDTCCIDKANSTELNEAINSMYKWYANSEFCVAYLFDYYSHKHKSMGISSWFNRCWTLQELISPQFVRFYDGLWRPCGTKADLCDELATRTGIDTDTLRGADPRRCSIAQRMSWAADRQATRIEDEAYSLLGLFDLSLPMLYGDGEKAFMTLQEKIMQYSDDPTILAWDSGFSDDPAACHGLLAKSPAAFRGCRNTTPIDEGKRLCKFTYNFTGVELRTRAAPCGMNTYLCVLDCFSSVISGQRDAILLERFEDEIQYARVCHGVTTVTTVYEEDISHWPIEYRTFNVRQTPNGQRTSTIHGFGLRFESLPDMHKSQMRYIQCLSRNGTMSEPDVETGAVVVDLSQDLWGTVALASFAKLQHQFGDYTLKGMKLGFDVDFNPTIKFISEEDEEDAEHNPDWRNLWLQKDIHKTGRCLSFSRHKLSDSRTVRNMHLTIDINRREIPSFSAVEWLAKCGNGPWNIWEVIIRAHGSFAKDARSKSLTEKRRTEQQHDAQVLRNKNKKDDRYVYAGMLLLGFKLLLTQRDMRNRKRLEGLKESRR